MLPTRVRCCFVGVLLAAGAAVAGAPPSATDGMYYADDPANAATSEGSIECPGTMRLVGSTLTFTVSAANGAAPLQYGTVHVQLDESGHFEGDVALPKRKPFTQRIDIDPAYAKLKTVKVDAVLFPIAGGGAASIVRLSVPGTADKDVEGALDQRCHRTLVHLPRRAGGKKSPYDGAYWARTGGGMGLSVQCPHVLLVSGGKLSFAVAAGYASYSASDVAIARGGTFERAIPLDQNPSDAAMQAAGTSDDDIAMLHAHPTFTVTGKVEGLTAAATGKSSHGIELHVRSDQSQDECNAQFIKKGFDLGDGYVDCDRLSPSQRARHAVCAM